MLSTINRLFISDAHTRPPPPSILPGPSPRPSHTQHPTPPHTPLFHVKRSTLYMHAWCGWWWYLSAVCCCFFCCVPCTRYVNNKCQLPVCVVCTALVLLLLLFLLFNHVLVDDVYTMYYIPGIQNYQYVVVFVICKLYTSTVIRNNNRYIRVLRWYSYRAYILLFCVDVYRWMDR